METAPLKLEKGLWWPSSETHLNQYGLEYQMDVRAVAIGLIPEQSRNLAVDIGAHVGIAAHHFSRFFKKVISFEPIRETFKCLERNVGNLENVELHRIALSDSHEKNISFIKHEGNTGYTEPTLEHLDGCEVTGTNNLDYYNLKPDLIKIDVEGFEPLVLKGALRTLTKHSPVIIIEVKGIGYSKDNPKESLDILSSLGYKVTHVDSHDYVLTKTKEPNLKFLPPAGRAKNPFNIGSTAR